MGNLEAGNRIDLRAPALRSRWVFAGNDAQIGVLRRWLKCLLPSCSSRDDLISAAVELGTNAVRHTASGCGGHFAVEVTSRMQMIRVAVYDDGGPNCPQVTDDILCEDGRGLMIVSALSVRMGVRGDVNGRVVWADILWTGQDLPDHFERSEVFSLAARETETYPRPPASSTYQDLPRPPW